MYKTLPDAQKQQKVDIMKRYAEKKSRYDILKNYQNSVEKRNWQNHSILQKIKIKK